MKDIAAAIQQYQTTYGRLPVSANVSTTSSDFTFGTIRTSCAAIGITNANGYQANNSEVMAALLDLTNFPSGSKVNIGHSLNPQNLVFLNVKATLDTSSPGIGPDGVYRDPWGNPYIIFFNLKETNCQDAFYRLASVSEIGSTNTNGLTDLFRTIPPPYTNSQTRDSFAAKISVMIWSLGPDGKADPNQKADQGVNKDNILSWQKLHP